MFRERMRRGKDDIERKSEEVVPTSCWGKLTSFQRALVSLIIIELLFLMGSFAIHAAFSFPWSPWTASGKCSDLCGSDNCTVKAFRRENGGLDADERWVDNEDPDENWADIPEELHLFISYPPGFFNEDKEDNDNTGQQTTSNEETKITPTVITTPTTITPTTITTTPTTITTTTPTTTTPITTTTEMPLDKRCPGRAPAGAIIYIIDKEDYDTNRYWYKCSVALVKPSLVLLNNDGCVILPLTGRTKKGDEFYYGLKIKTDPKVTDPKAKRIKIVKFVTFKKLAAAYLSDPFSWPRDQYPRPLTYNVKADKACTIIWPPSDDVIYGVLIKSGWVKMTVDLTGKAVPSDISSALFIFENNSYYLFGFVSSGELILNIYLGEYKDWLSKL